MRSIIRKKLYPAVTAAFTTITAGYNNCGRLQIIVRIASVAAHFPVAILHPLLIHKTANKESGHMDSKHTEGQPERGNEIEQDQTKREKQ